MAKYEVQTNIGYGWERVVYAPIFDTEEEAWDYVYGDDPTDTTRWDGRVDVFEIEEDEY
jgi:hypothetical protein